MSSQRLLLITHDFPPDFSAGVPRLERFARNLPECGWQPFVLALQRDPSESDAVVPAADDFFRSIVVERCRAWTWGRSRASSTSPTEAAAPASDQSNKQNLEQDESPVGSSGQLPLRRWLGNLKSLLLGTPDKGIYWVPPAVAAGKRMIREHKLQAILTSGPPHSIHLAGRRLKQATGLPWIADFRDPWARRPWGHKKFNPWGQRLFPRLERICVAAADRVILNTGAMADDFREFYPQWESKFLTIPNGCDAHLVSRIERLISEVPERNDDRPLVLMHAGALYRQRDPRPLIEAIGLLNRRGIAIRFEQIGPCSGDFRIPDFVRRQNCSEFVSFTPPVPRDEALRRMATADFLLLIQPGTDIQIPGKLFEMIPFRKPILAIADAGATADLVNQYQLGAVAEDHAPAAIAAVIEKQIQSRQQSGAQLCWDKAIHDFDGRTLTAELAAALGAIVSGDDRHDANSETHSAALAADSHELYSFAGHAITPYPTNDAGATLQT